MIKETIILAGGLGTRLRSAVGELPKCMAPVNGIPFISYLIGWLQLQGVQHFIFSLGYKSEILMEYLDGTFPYLNKTYVVEKEPLGTGGGIRLAATKAIGTDVLVVNGDTYFDADLLRLSQTHQSISTLCTLALKPMQAFSRYGSVTLEANQIISAFHEKKYCDAGLINGGVYALQVDALKEGYPDKFSFETEFLQKNVVTHLLGGLMQDGYFKDIGIPEDYAQFAVDAFIDAAEIDLTTETGLQSWTRQIQQQLKQHGTQL